MTKTTKKQVTFGASGNVPPGIVMHLTFGQADARRHLLTPVKDWHKNRADDRMLGFTSDKSVFFKAGEKLGLEYEGELDRGLAAVTGSAPAGAAEKPAKATPPSDAAIEKARTEGIKAGRKQMLEEIEARNLVFEAAEAADAAVDSLQEKLSAESDADRKASIQQELDSALSLQAEADGKVKALPELKA